MGRKSKASAAEPMDVDQGTSWPSDELRMLEERVLNIEIINESKDEYELEFDLIGVEAPIANAIRRVLLAEVPTMAIEKVYLYQNTSVIQDEVLCHRFGLLPIKADPREFEWPTTPVTEINETTDCDEEPQPDEKRNIVFQFHVVCQHNPKAEKSWTSPESLYINSSAYTKLFKWIPVGDQAEKFANDPIRMVHDDILVAKLRPGQEIEAHFHCVKGIGRDHAKFSPVGTASYRLLPTIRLKERITGEAAERLQKSFSKGVIEIVDESAKVADARRDTCSRNVLRHADLADKVELGRKKQHYIFSVESIGALPAHTLVSEACNILAAKAAHLRSLIEGLDLKSTGA